LLQTRFANDIFIQNLCFSIGKLLFAGWSPSAVYELQIVFINLPLGWD
jgi:hypothetical protein